MIIVPDEATILELAESFAKRAQREAHPPAVRLDVYKFVSVPIAPGREEKVARLVRIRLTLE